MDSSALAGVAAEDKGHWQRFRADAAYLETDPYAAACCRRGCFVAASGKDPFGR